MTTGDSEALRAAIKTTEYKYFGDYEFSEDQRAAVDLLVAHAEKSLASMPAASPQLPAEPVQDRGLVEEFQCGVDNWMDACFGEPIKSDQLERADRFTEEALELAQTFPDFTAERAHALVDYVFNRDVGERLQEVGGVMVTLAALCNTAGISMEDAAQTELARVWTKVEAIRAKQAAKPTGSALPIALSAAEPAIRGDEVETDSISLQSVLAIMEKRAAYFDRTNGHYERANVARSYRATAKEIAKLPALAAIRSGVE